MNLLFKKLSRGSAMFLIVMLSVFSNLLPGLGHAQVLEPTFAKINNFIGTNQNRASGNLNAFGFGYYSEPVVYSYKDGSKEKYVSNYSGWMLKYVRYFGPTSALTAHYVQAHAEENIRELSGSALYGLNLNGPGVGLYLGLSYTLKQRTQFAGEQRVSDEKDYGWDYPIGIQLQNAMFTMSVETRYKHFILQGDNVTAESVRFPLYFSILTKF